MKSTLAGEADAADGASDMSFFVAKTLGYILTGKSALDVDMNAVPFYVATDCKSLFDACQKDNPTVEEKRTLLGILNLKRTTPKDRLRWVPTTRQFADGLTKVDTKLRAIFTEYCGHSYAQLHD